MFSYQSYTGEEIVWNHPYLAKLIGNQNGIQKTFLIKDSVRRNANFQFIRKDTLRCITVRNLRSTFGQDIIQQLKLYNYSTYRTNHMPTRSVRQVRVYAFGAPTTRLRVWCTYEALTNQGEDASVYRPRSLLHTIDSHHPNKYIILHVFRACGYDSLVLLSQYEH